MEKTEVLGPGKRQRMEDGEERWRRLCLAKPFFVCDASLPKKACQKSHANITLVRIGNNYREIAPAHLRVSSASIRTLKA